MLGTPLGPPSQSVVHEMHHPRLSDRCVAQFEMAKSSSGVPACSLARQTPALLLLRCTDPVYRERECHYFLWNGSDCGILCGACLGEQCAWQMFTLCGTLSFSLFLHFF